MFVAAGLEAFLGFFIMPHPFQGTVSLVVWVAIFLIASGLVRLAHSWLAPARGRGWPVFTWVMALILGTAVWLEWTIAELWFLGLFLAVDFLCHGVSWSALALAERRPFRDGL
jgi:uncharacterized membrane protein HdeD (DUF308 family)